MMREVKFKVWDNFRKKFAKQITTFKFDRCGNVNLVVYLDRANKTREITEQEKIYTNDFELMQFTGFKDKNGREIYEGDIVKYVAQDVYGNCDSGYEIRGVGEVTYDERIGCYIVMSDEDESNFIDICEFEVIGNIFEGDRKKQFLENKK